MKQIFLLAAVTVIFHTNAGEMGTVNVNVLSKGETTDINMMGIQQIHQGAAMMTQKLVGEPVIVDHVTIMNVITLGSFTEEEFREGLPAEVLAAMDADHADSEQAAALKERIEAEAAATQPDSNDDFSNIKL